MPTTDRQYNPISTSETGTNDGLSVRFLLDMAANINNAHKYAFAHKVLMLPCVPEWQSHSATTDERVICPFIWRMVPDGYTTFLWILKHYRFAGGANVTWKLYCSSNFYQGPLNMDTDYLFPGYSSATITTDENDHKRDTSTSLSVVRGTTTEPATGITYNACYLTLTAQAADVDSRAAITAIDLLPWGTTTES